MLYRPNRAQSLKTRDEADMLTELQKNLFAERLTRHEDLLPGYRADMREWSDTVLTHGGHTVCPPAVPDPNLRDLVKKYRLRGGEDLIVRSGRRNDCHENSANLQSRGRTDDGVPITAWETGYALSEDGLWRQHSWALSEETVVETTTARLLYAGLKPE